MKAGILQIVRFGIVGVGATLVHLVVAWLAEGMVGLAPLVANAVGFLVAFGVSYLGHFYWTFGQRDGHRGKLPRFLIVAGTGYALSNLVIVVVMDVFGGSFEAALLGILVAVPTTTFALSRLWAFRDR